MQQVGHPQAMNFSTDERQSWMAVLAQASPSLLAQYIAELKNLPPYRCLRPPEIGLVMVRGRAGGTGQPFNLGEMTITRCTIQIHFLEEDLPLTGFGYVTGRSHQHAELAALCDALLQHSTWHSTLQTQVIAPLQAAASRQQEIQQRQTAATKVNFFTMVRGS